MMQFANGKRALGFNSLGRTLPSHFTHPNANWETRRTICADYPNVSTIANPALPQGSTVLVTGANGFLGAHIVDQFLRNGYRVRGTVRDPNKDRWLLEYFDQQYGNGSFELVAVPDMQADGAYNQAVKDVSVFVHSAASVAFDNDPNKIIPVTVAGTVNALKAAYSEPSVKRFVLTSSSAAAVGLLSSGVMVTEDTWNEEAVKDAWSGEPYPPNRSVIVYEASKAQSEQAVWKYHEENRRQRPDLTINAGRPSLVPLEAPFDTSKSITVLPNLIFGRPIDAVNQGRRTSAGFVAALWKGEEPSVHLGVPRQYYVDVEDTALLHVAGAVLPHVQSQRIFAFAGRFNWDTVLDEMRALDPKRKLTAHFSGGEDPNEIVPRAKAEKLLRELGRPGWTSLKDTIAATVKDIKV
ncbi:Aldehyde reductase [Fusarium albosuccineum]|uniref:Aldehyde reductase n=1 Tax=Fusarium albosuccineum TaxID=1237068 RepID=A0A8H4PGB4_9HYPO|nr:Aldehyde reductase [Fusarium albosuccineum]